MKKDDNFTFSEELMKALYTNQRGFMIYNPKEKKFYQAKGMSPYTVPDKDARIYLRKKIKQHLGMWREFLVENGDRNYFPYKKDDKIIEYKLMPVKTYTIKEFYNKKDWKKDDSAKKN